MKKLILVCGPAGIGKSTFCKQYAAAHPEEDVRIVASDEIRRSMTGSYQNFLPGKNMAPVYFGVAQEAMNLFSRSQSITVMLDTTMLNDERRLFFLNHIPSAEERDLYLLKLHDYDLCLQRNKLRPREKWVPENIIRDMIKGYRDPSPSTKERFDHVETFYLDEQKRAQ